MIGYKTFDKHFRCRGYQYRVGETYSLPEYGKKLEICKVGFHFCRIPKDCDEYYLPSKNTRYAEISAIGEIVHRDNRSATNTILIVRELSRDEIIAKTNGCFETAGTKTWYLNGLLHRTDGPAVERTNGAKEWYQNDQLHRVDGPAVEQENGTKKWYQNGKLHRTDGPAVEYSNGDHEWFQNGKYHRLDGPAVEWADYNKQWCLDGKLHREDGPAIEYYDGHQEWWLNGIQQAKK